MKIAAKIEISPHEEALIEEYIKNMKQEHPNLELTLNDIYDSALRTGLDIVMDQIRTERKQKIMEDWIHETKSYTRKNDSGGV
jgi:hypothetical protein